MSNKLTFFILLLAASISMAQENSQQIIPVEDHEDYHRNSWEITTGAYIQDVNNLLDPFTGTWTGAYYNKTFTFTISEYTLVLDDIMQDLLLIRYKILDSNNTVIADTTTLPDDANGIIKGIYFGSDDSRYLAYYVGEESECGQSGYVTIKTLNNAMQMDVYYTPERSMIAEETCLNGAASHPFPVTEHFTLTKQ